MLQSKKDKSFFSHHDRNYHNVPTYETNEPEQEFVDFNGQISHVNNYWTDQPYPYWVQSMEQMSDVQYPPIMRDQTYDSQMTWSVQPQYPSTSASSPTSVSKISPALPPAPVSKTSTTKISPALPSAPLGRIPQESTAVLVPAVVHHPTIPASVSSQYSQPPPPPSYHYHKRSILPHIPRKERRSERDYFDRYRHEHHLIMSYFGRCHNIKPYQKHNRWYY